MSFRYPYTGNPSDFLRFRRLDGLALTVASHSSRARSLQVLVPSDSDYALVMPPLRGSPGNWSMDPVEPPSVVVWHGCKVEGPEGPEMTSTMPLPDKAARPVARGSTRSISVTQAEWEKHIHPAIQAIADVRQKQITSYGVVFRPAKPE